MSGQTEAQVDRLLEAIDELTDDGRVSIPAYLARALIERLTKPARLLPAESLAATVALAQVQRGEAPGQETSVVCIYALNRLAGRYDWTAGAADE